MSIPVSLIRLSQDEITLSFPGTSPDVPLLIRPGQFLRLEPSPVVYGEITAIKTNDRSGRLQAKVRILHGNPSLFIREATLLEPEQISRELPAILGEMEAPLVLNGQCCGNLMDLGTLTLIKGERIEDKHPVLLATMNAIAPYQPLLVMDPLGVFVDEPGVATLTVGREVWLSLQSFGINRFLTEIGAVIPKNFHGEALHLLAKKLPTTPDFFNFRNLLKPEQYEDFAAKPLILQALYNVYNQHLFAETPDEVFSLPGHLRGAMTAVDFSSLSEPWKTHCYGELCREAFQNAEGGYILVLVYPENYLPDLDKWILKAEESDINLIVLTSPYANDTLDRLANNVIAVNDDLHGIRVSVEGSMTRGIPVRLPFDPELAPPGAGWPDAGSIGAAAPLPPSSPRAESTYHVPSAFPEMEPEITSDTTFPNPDYSLYETSHFDHGVSDAVAEPEFSPAANVPSAPLMPEEPAYYAPVERLSEQDQALNDIFGETPQFHFEIEPDYEAARPEAVYEAPHELQSGGFDDPFSFDVDGSSDSIGSVGGQAFSVPTLDEVPVYQTHTSELETLASQAGFQAGEKVRHEKYGVGVVSKIIPLDDKVAISVVFESAGKRTFHADNLELVRV